VIGSHNQMTKLIYMYTGAMSLPFRQHDFSHIIYVHVTIVIQHYKVLLLNSTVVLLSSVVPPVPYYRFVFKSRFHFNCYSLYYPLSFSYDIKGGA
jgi:hypothetical protein